MRLLALALILSPAAASAAEPWYERDTCVDAMRVVVGVDFERSDQVLRELEASRDLDDKACAVYLRALESEMRITIYGENPQTFSYRNKHLKRMLGFARAHAKYGPRFADLEMEARMRRIRALFEEGDKGGAVGEARRVSKMIDAVKHTSPTVDFVKGVLYSALGEANMLARTALWAAGVSGNVDEGTKALTRLMLGKSVYRSEARYLAFSFAKERAAEGENSPFGSPLSVGSLLVRAHPDNPQFAFDYATALRQADQCERAQQVNARWVEQLEREPDAWTPSIRAKIYWIASACSLAEGQVAKAVEYRDKFAQQEFEDFAKDLAELSQRLDHAQRSGG